MTAAIPQVHVPKAIAIEFNGSFSVLRMTESACERLLSMMTRRRVSALVTASVLSVGCSASAAVCRADGRQEANARAAIRRKRSFACFISLLWTQVKGILQEYNAQ